MKFPIRFPRTTVFYSIFSCALPTLRLTTFILTSPAKNPSIKLHRTNRQNSSFLIVYFQYSCPTVLTSVTELDQSQNTVCVTCTKQIILCFVYSWIRDSFHLYSSLLLLLLLISYRGKRRPQSLCLFLVHYYLFQ